MIVVSDIRLPLGATDEEAVAEAKKILDTDAEGTYRVRKKSFDLRRGSPAQICSVVATFGDDVLEQEIAKGKPKTAYAEKHRFVPKIGKEPLHTRPVVVGSGPAGLFAAYLLAQYGYRPILLERGADVASRVQAVSSFFADGVLDPNTNIQFGEGGAGTFSDGKLVSRIHDELCEYVLKTFHRFGAPDEILYKAKPHIGTDQLRRVIRQMRQSIEAYGGEVRFLCRLDDIDIRSGKVEGITCTDGQMPAEVVVLAIGHSARDTFEMLSGKNLVMTETVLGRITDRTSPGRCGPFPLRQICRGSPASGGRIQSFDQSRRQRRIHLLHVSRRGSGPCRFRIRRHRNKRYE